MLASSTAVMQSKGMASEAATANDMKLQQHCITATAARMWLCVAVWCGLVVRQQQQQQQRYTCRAARRE
jgi:hypothetical protein